MKIRVDLFYRIGDIAPERYRHGPVEIALPETTTVAELLAKLEIPADTPKILLVDGRATPPETVLREGQTVTIFPPLDGG